MNQTKVVFKDKTEMEEFIVNSYNQAPSEFSFILEEESQNLYFKGLLMKEGSVISDRQMRTLKSELYRQITQDFGYRVVRDEHLAYYFFDQSTEKLFSKLSKYLRTIAGLPDYFFDESLSLPLDEYILNSDNIELINLGKNLNFCKSIYQGILENKIVSASTTEVLIDHLRFKEDDHIYIFESFYEGLPQILKENLKVPQVTLLSYDFSLNWRSQIDLYESLKSRDNISFTSFENQIEEVRYILSKLKENGDDIAVLYPKNKGYENLFNYYQREFFLDPIVLKKLKKRSRIFEAIELLKYKSGDINTFNYFRSIAAEPGFDEKKREAFNKVNFKKEGEIKDLDSRINYTTFINLLNETLDISDELDFISEMQISLPTSLELELVEWLELLSVSLSPNSKNVKLTSDYTIQRIDQSLNGDFSEVYICGWGEHAFKPKLSSVLSQKTISLIERDLGFNAWSMENSVAKKFFLDPIFTNDDVKIKFSYPKIDDTGKIVEKSVFNHLIEQGKFEVVDTKARELIGEVSYTENSLIELDEYKVSASSLAVFDDCPFKFYIQKVIGLNQESNEDYFLDPLKEGSLIHELLEEFINKPITEQEFIDKVKILSESKDPDFNVFKAPYIEKISKRVWNILKIEKGFLSLNNIKVAAIEKGFEFSASLKDRSFGKKKEKFLVRGKIDRIDKDQDDNIVIYDYKRGATGISMFKNYNGKDLKAQLFLYCLAAKEGFLIDFNQVAAFQYINTTEQKRSGGFVKKDFKGSGLIKEATAQSFIEDELFEEKLNLFLDNFWKVLEEIDKGSFSPRPKNHEVCIKCEWKESCRKSETFL